MSGLSPIIFASYMILLVHLTEILVWASFFTGNLHFRIPALYFISHSMNIRRLESKFYLPFQWRLLEGIIELAGLLTFAVSKGVLFG